MFANLCPHTIGLEALSLEELVELAARCGFEGVDFPTGEADSTEKARRAADLLSDKGLRWGLFYLPCDFSSADEQLATEGLERLEQIAPIAAAAGCTRTYNHVWPGSNDCEYDENRRRHVERFSRVVDVLRPHGIRLGIEFIGAKTLRDTFEHPFMYTLPEAAEFARELGGGAGVVLDTFHLYTSGGSAEDVAEHLTGDLVVNVHVNDAAAGRSREEQMDLERQMPMTSGLVDSAGVLRELNALGYDGPAICEPFNPTVGRFRSMEPATVTDEVSGAMRTLFEAAGLS